MRLLPISIIALLAVLLTASLASAQPDRSLRAFENAVELVDGEGTAILNLRGALIGSLEKGKVTITNLPDGSGTDISVQGAETTRTDGNTTVYTGDDLRFRVFRGRWRVEIVGDGIDASAVGFGWLRLFGTAGRYSFAGGSFRAWPEESLSIKLGD
jgi:hypothetical protein